MLLLLRIDIVITDCAKYHPRQDTAQWVVWDTDLKKRVVGRPVARYVNVTSTKGRFKL